MRIPSTTLRRAACCALGFLLTGAAPALAEPKFNDAAMWFFAAICLYVTFLAYIVPGLVAWDRRHHAAVGIWVVTLLLGWTGVGWLAALVWACSSPTRRVPLPAAPPLR